MTIPCPIAAASVSDPDRPAVVSASEILTYSELDRRINAAIAGIKRRGVGPGDRVGIRLASGLNTPVILWALFRLRSIAVLLSDRDPDRNIRDNYSATGCRLLITDVPGPESVPTASPSGLCTDPTDVRLETATDLDLDSNATIVFTSGSEGRPKAVVHTLANHWFNARGSQTAIPVSPDTRWAVVLPTHHVGGLSIFFRCFLFGGAVVLVDREDRRPSELAAHGVTHVSMVPTQLIDWLARADCALLTKLDTILVGGAATPSRIRRQAVETGLPVRFTYGSTEMASQIATTERGELDFTAGYAGHVLPYRKVRIENGEILVGGETRFAGYWSNGGLKRPFDDEGWFATGDIGRLDGDRLIVTGRRDSRFISGGENVYPEEIEEAIVSAGLAEAAIVLSVDDERFGTRPIAYVRPLCSAEVLRAGLAGLLPSFKIPDQVRLLPEGMAGSKSDRRRLITLTGEPSSRT
ncbi:MAG TPA: AMP-binding protein [Rhodothermales bacterium]|nr:AMP-binding protein [Rhodothermales bacterium]